LEILTLAMPSKTEQICRLVWLYIGDKALRALVPALKGLKPTLFIIGCRIDKT